MKSIKSFIMEGCAYTVLLSFVLYMFLGITGVGSSGVPFLKFLLVFGYGFLIPAARLLKEKLSAKPILATALHYATLLIGFIIVYLLNTSTSTNTNGNIFVAVFLFTLLYAAIYGVKALIKHYYDKKSPKGGKRSNTKKGSSDTYTPRFGA